MLYKIITFTSIIILYLIQHNETFNFFHIPDKYYRQSIQKLIFIKTTESKKINVKLSTICMYSNNDKINFYCEKIIFSQLI